MVKVAIVDKSKSRADYSKYFDFEYDEFHLLDKDTNKRILVADITLNRNDPEKPNYFDIDYYDFIILVGSDACKHIGKITSVTKYQGYLIDDKFLPIVNPNMLTFKPEGLGAFKKAVDDIHNYIHNKPINNINKAKLLLIDDRDIALEYLTEVKNLVLNSNKKPLIALDTETSALYARDGWVLGICMAISQEESSYINADIIDEEIIKLYQEIIDNSAVVFHNAKFDLHMLEYHFNLKIKEFHDTMLLHYCLDERTGTHDLKSLSIKYTDLGEYDKDLEIFKRNYCKQHKVKISDFTYDLIPFEILGKYGATDPIATLKLFEVFYQKVYNSDKLTALYNNLLIPGIICLKEIEDNGVPFNRERLEKAKIDLNNRIFVLEKELYNFKVIHEFEDQYGKIFNVNSPQMLRVVLFDMLGLAGPGKLTSTDALSTDAEVLEELSKKHKLPALLLEIKKAKKIKSTYIDKILMNLDKDSRLRTNFNLTTTTSGRLSSSGKLNMQQLPRDDKTVKKCIKANPGYKIVSQDLKTAEMYIVAVLSGDKVLQRIFIEGGDYHSQMAVIKFKLPYTWQEVNEFHRDLRQAAKTVSFEILYKLNFYEEALENFKELKKWLKKQKLFIEQHGYTYSFFGRKRRLPNVFSKSTAVKNHEVRSGVNALVQGPASDVNLLACIEMQSYIKKKGLDAKIFGLVHDSILAEVADECIEEYSKKLAEFTQKDRGLSIPGCPIGIDLEIGNDYSFTEE